MNNSLLGRLVRKLILVPIPSLRATLSVARIDRRPLAGQRVLITGASSGIGRAAALRLAAEGSELVLVARRTDELERLRAEIAGAGWRAECVACDLTDSAAVDRLTTWVGDYGGVDVLVNNAGRSIRRPLTESFDRFHDFERVMAVNYFGAARLTLGLLPGMIARGGGHIVNVGTWSVPVGASPNFAAYHSSKAALAAFGRCVRAELSDTGITVTEIHYPLVRTAMSAPTDKFGTLPGLTPDNAAAWIVSAIRSRPERLVPLFAVVLAVLGHVSPTALSRLLRSRN